MKKSKPLIKNWFYSETQRKVIDRNSEGRILRNYAPNGEMITEITSEPKSNFDDAILIYSAECEMDDFFFRQFKMKIGDSDKIIRVIFDSTQPDLPPVKSN